MALTSFPTVFLFRRCCRSPKGGRDRAPSSRADQQLAIERPFKIEGLDDVRERAGNIVAGAGVELSHAFAARPLHTDASHFHSAAVVFGSAGELRLFDGVRDHHRAERRDAALTGCSPSLEPREELH